MLGKLKNLVPLVWDLALRRYRQTYCPHNYTVRERSKQTKRTLLKVGLERLHCNKCGHKVWTEPLSDNILTNREARKRYRHFKKHWSELGVPAHDVRYRIKFFRGDYAVRELALRGRLYRGGFLTGEEVILEQLANAGDVLDPETNQHVPAASFDYYKIEIDGADAVNHFTTVWGLPRMEEL